MTSTHHASLTCGRGTGCAQAVLESRKSKRPDQSGSGTQGLTPAVPTKAVGPGGLALTGASQSPFGPLLLVLSAFGNVHIYILTHWRNLVISELCVIFKLEVIGERRVTLIRS